MMQFILRNSKFLKVTKLKLGRQIEQSPRCNSGSTSPPQSGHRFEIGVKADSKDLLRSPVRRGGAPNTSDPGNGLNSTGLSKQAKIKSRDMSNARNRMVNKDA